MSLDKVKASYNSIYRMYRALGFNHDEAKESTMNDIRMCLKITGKLP